MNVIEYIEGLPNKSKLFEETKNVKISSYHLFDNVGEGSTSIWFLSKTAADHLSGALMSLVIHQFVRNGDFYFEENEEPETIYSTVRNHLNWHYSKTEFRETDKPTLTDLLERYGNENQFRRIFQNEDWNDEIELKTMVNFILSNETVIKQYQLKREWNDEDFLFETNGFYIRYNWGTSA